MFVLAQVTENYGKEWWNRVPFEKRSESKLGYEWRWEDTGVGDRDLSRENW